MSWFYNDSGGAYYAPHLRGHPIGILAMGLIKKINSDAGENFEILIKKIL